MQRFWLPHDMMDVTGRLVSDEVVEDFDVMNDVVSESSGVDADKHSEASCAAGHPMCEA